MPCRRWQEPEPRLTLEKSPAGSGVQTKRQFLLFLSFCAAHCDELHAHPGRTLPTRHAGGKAPRALERKIMGNASVKRNTGLTDKAALGTSRKVRTGAPVDPAGDPQVERTNQADDIVNRASNDSFPASDAPAWINCGEPAA
jgi:hypothetical protein